MKTEKRKKIALVGTHGSGKTTMALDLVSRLKRKNIVADIMPEVARGSPYLLCDGPSSEAQLHLFGAQIECELRYIRGRGLLILDRSLLDIVMYTELFFPNSVYNKMMQTFVKGYMATYDIIFRTTIVYNSEKTEDNLRPRSNELQMQAHAKLGSMLDEYYPGYINLPDVNDPVAFMFDHIINSSTGGQTLEIPK